MNVHFPASQRTWPGRLVNLAVVVVVLALAAATFVLSYSGLHAIVLQAGVSVRLARIYPALFDAVFVIACVAAVMLRDARWWARSYAWLVIVVVVGVVGAADAVHAMNVTLPHRKTEGVVAAVPWVLVLLGFSLMLTMLRQSYAQHAAAKAPAAVPAPTAPVAPELPWAQEPAPTRGAPARPQTAPAPEPAERLPEPAGRLEAEAVDSLGANAIEEEPVPAPAPDGEQAAEHGAVAPEELELAEQPSGAANTETAVQHEPAVQPSAAGDIDSGPDQHDHPVAEERDAESAAAFSFFDHWKSAEESGQGDSGHPATVPGQVIDDDAPPFATAPFATVPRLNRVRSTPTPPDDDDEEE